MATIVAVGLSAVGCATAASQTSVPADVADLPASDAVADGATRAEPEPADGSEPIGPTDAGADSGSTSIR
ncbi:MAG: hypothetical protein AAF962_08430 [Actinomycetota bacterium]